MKLKVGKHGTVTLKESPSARRRRKRREGIDRAQPHRRKTPAFLTRAGKGTPRAAADEARLRGFFEGIQAEHPFEHPRIKEPLARRAKASR